MAHITENDLRSLQADQMKEAMAQSKRKFRYDVLALAQDTLVRMRAGAVPGEHEFKDEDVIVTAEKYMKFITADAVEAKEVTMKVISPS